MRALLLLLLACCLPHSSNQDMPPPSPLAGTFAFVGVHVLAPGGDRMLPAHTVLVDGERMVAVGPSSEVRLAPGVRRVEGAGLYLVPGLADMHAHLPSPDSPEGEVERYLKLDLARGVTTVRSMRGHASHLALRRRVQRGELPGPNLYLSAPPLIVRDPEAEQAAHSLIDRAKEQGYDFLKWLAGNDQAAYDRLMRHAAQAGLKVAGHAPPDGLRAALRAGQASLEHLEPYTRIYKQDPSEFRELIQQQRAAGIFSCPDLYWYEIDWMQRAPSALLGDPALRYVDPELVSRWRGALEKALAEHGAGGEAHALAARAKSSDMQEALIVVKALWAAGVPLLISAGDGPFIIPGFSIAHELRSFVRAGIPAAATLRAATANAAAFFGESDRWGSIAAGRRADLLLLRGNPLEDIEHIEDIAGVMVRGSWYPREQLDRWLGQIAADRAATSRSPP